VKRYAKTKYPARLPSTGVTIEVKRQMTEIATDEGISLGEVQRRAFDFFLSRNTSETSYDACKAGRDEPN